MDDGEFERGEFPKLATLPAAAMFSHLLKAAVPKRALVSSPSFVRLSSTSAPTTTTSIPAAAQSPNYPTTWSQNQSTRPAAQSSPRFEQTVMETQPNPLSAMQLIADEPIRLVNGRKAVCDGGASCHPLSRRAGGYLFLSVPAGSGPLGHPKIFINLVRSRPVSCHCNLIMTAGPTRPSRLWVRYSFCQFIDTL